jgi:hypothetical protein
MLKQVCRSTAFLKQTNEGTIMSMEIVYNTAPDELDVDGRNREIRTMLHHGVCEITFTKVNGELRTMPCTLDESLLPAKVESTAVKAATLDRELMTEEAVNEFHKTRPYNPNVLNVWCLDKMEWRSFRVANVKKVTRTQ